MAEIERPHLDDRETKRGFASAFVQRLGGGQQSTDRRLGPRIWAVGLAVVVVAAIAVGIGFLARPHPPAPAAHAAAKATTFLPSMTTTTLNQSPTIPQPVFAPNAGIPAAGVPMGAPAPGLPVGVVQQQPANPPAPDVQRVVAPAAKPAPATFSATTGYGCGESASLVFTQHGFYSDGKNGWIRLGSGGVNAGGCNNTFDAMPMSGSATSDDTSNYATWQFRTGLAKVATCHVSIWIPSDSNIQDVGGHPSTYLIYDSFAATGTAPFAVQVDQTGNRGKWVTTSVRSSSGALAVKLLSRGIDYDKSGPDYAHHAVSAVHVDCTA